MLRKIRRYLDFVATIPYMYADLRSVQREVASVQEAIGRIELRQTRATSGQRLIDCEFRVFSQWGEDGIIQFLIRNLNIPSKTFIEFGVESYREANTRFLLMHDNWKGLIIDGGQANIDSVKNSDLYWRFDLTAVCAFVTPSNINSLIQRNGFAGEIGLLSVDIDGQDYWVWKNITSVNPAIVVAEYNAMFGPDRAVTVPLDESFVRSSAHYSYIYYGASLAAMIKLGQQKGYSCVGCNSAGNNAFFVRNDLMPAAWRAMNPQQAYVAARFREYRDENGKLSYPAKETARAVLDKLPVVEV